MLATLADKRLKMLESNCVKAYKQKKKKLLKFLEYVQKLVKIIYFVVIYYKKSMERRILASSCYKVQKSLFTSFHSAQRYKCFLSLITIT